MRLAPREPQGSLTVGTEGRGGGLQGEEGWSAIPGLKTGRQPPGKEHRQLREGGQETEAVPSPGALAQGACLTSDLQEGRIIISVVLNP